MNLRAGIVGCGRIASTFDEDPLRREIWSHAGAYRASPLTDLVAAADIDANKLHAFGTRWGVSALYEDYHRMLKHEQLDLLSVCTPPASHAEVVLAAMDAGVRAIFCEKPLACSLAEADRIVEEATRRRVGLQVNHSRRWNLVYEEARQRIRQGEVGQVLAIVGHGSSALFTSTIHLLDMMRFLSGDVQWVQAVLQPPPVRVVDGCPDPGAAAMLGLSGGTTGLIQALAPDARYVQFEVDVWGDRGRLTISQNGRAAGLRRYGPSRHESGLLELADTAAPVGDPAVNEQRMVKAVEELARWLQGSGSIRCTGADGLAVLEVIFAIHASAQRGGERVELPLRERNWRWGPEGVTHA